MKFDYLTDESEKSLVSLFSPSMRTITSRCLWLMGLLIILFWPKKDFSGFIEAQEAPWAFVGIFVSTLLIHSYLSLRGGRGEIFSRDYFARQTREKVRTFEEENPFLSYGFISFLYHTAFLLLLFLPFLFTAGALSGISWEVFAKALSVVFASALLCRLWGFCMYLRYGKRSLTGYLLSRIFFLFYVFGTGVWGPYANPILLLYALDQDLEILTRSPVGPYSFHMGILFLTILLFTMANQAMVMKGYRQRETSI